jgi:hypothetical protein
LFPQDIVEVTRDLPEALAEFESSGKLIQPDTTLAVELHATDVTLNVALIIISLLLCFIVAAFAQDIVEVTRDLPEALAEFGRVQISRKQVARLIGQVRNRYHVINFPEGSVAALWQSSRWWVRADQGRKQWRGSKGRCGHI